ncbi:hypothetical protein KDU71_09215 [Carboxylicivirga sediminis]|uniref:Glycosyltransferase subfamily 4-like N-terminal domain-containing protein n=1 Tax=Carboxylicivirga sediminis TaxID=2006564 RepID=A0A941F4D2_9BACT|nr:hypothetical protein [Carboxylicivirga sediminis]MBR8535733.1 hypothetical protein [Carboxylicivirga sediminis]
MKTILIIYPHWHPANLAGVQRPRLIGNYLKQLGWHPRVLTVEAGYFEETPDPDFEQTFSSDYDVTRVKAFKVTKPRLIGDIGLRAFYQLYKKAREIIRNEHIDFIWLPIPSFYNALLGRLLYDRTKVPYGVDYIDPWVRDISNQNNRRAKLSQWVARILEPIAIKKVSVISGVSTPYYAPAIERNFPEIASQLLTTDYSLLTTQAQTLNPNTSKPITHVAMPYGFDPNDHKIKLNNLTYPWDSTLLKPKSNQLKPKIWLYAGAFLPNSHVLMDAFFEAIAQMRQVGQWDETIQLWFIGTGPYPAKRITSYASDHAINDIVFEQRERFPFLQVLNFLSAADTVMVIGSTEEHYTASKTYQSILSERPVVSIFHHLSSAVNVMEDCGADAYTVRYKPEMSHTDIVNAFKEVLSKRLQEDHWQPDLSALAPYSSKESARKLIEAIESVI